MTVQLPTTEEKILQHIKSEENDSRTLSIAMGMSQEYIRRVVTALAEEGKVRIHKAPRGYTYEVTG